MADRFDVVLNYLTARLRQYRGKTCVDLNARASGVVSVELMAEMNRLESKYPAMTADELRETAEELVAFGTVDRVDGGYRMRGWAGADNCLPERKYRRPRLGTRTNDSEWVSGFPVPEVGMWA